VRSTVLPGGLRVVSEQVPGARTAAFGIWVGVGSRDESPQRSGASHYLEHLLFKGTGRRSALDISAAMDDVGGELNAYTAKEHTCYYARVLDADLPLAVDLVSDMVTSSVVAATDVEVERGVILEEISMHDDDPGDVVHDVFAEAVFGGHPLGRPVIGTAGSIAALTRAQVAGFYRRHYRPAAMVVAAAGHVAHERLVDLVGEAFAAGSLTAEALTGPDAAAGARRPDRRLPRTSAATRVVDRATEQAHLVLGARGLHRHDERRFTLGVLNNALGGGMSSRLFQEIREKRGLAYSVYSFHTQYADAGLFGVYAGCSPGRADLVLRLIREELHRAASDGLTPAEVARGQAQLKGGLLLGLEDSGSRMSRVAKGELLYGEVLPVDELVRRIDAVTTDDVRRVAADLLQQPMALGAIGPFDGHDFQAAVNP